MRDKEKKSKKLEMTVKALEREGRVGMAELEVREKVRIFMFC